MTNPPQGPSTWLLAGLVLSGLAVTQVWRAGIELMEEFSVPLSFGRDLGGDTQESFPLGFVPFVLSACVFAAGFVLLFLLVRAGQGRSGARYAAGAAVAVVTVAVAIAAWNHIDADGPRCAERSYTQTTECLSDARTMVLDGVVPALPGTVAAGLLLLAPPVRRGNGGSAS